MIPINKTFLISFIVLILIPACISFNNTKWICENNICKRLTNDKSYENIDRIEYESQNICKLSCDKYGSLWPHPTKVTHISSKRIYFSPNTIIYNITAVGQKTSEFLKENVEIFKSNILKECVYERCTLNQSREIHINLSIESAKTALGWNTNESYTLTIETKETGGPVNVYIKAFTIYGARHGLETLSQLITANFGSGLVMPDDAQIIDEPAYKHRGLMLDTSRNFISVKKILQTLDGMATSKLNVFHWHATDSHSFPMEIASVPQLHLTGAYSPEMTYSTCDTQSIIKYAKTRGIRTIIEIDGPAHAGAGWQFGLTNQLGELETCFHKLPYAQYCYQPPCGQLNPTNPNVYEILKKIYGEIVQLNPDETIHMGGDEVQFRCWLNCSVVINYLNAIKISVNDSNMKFLWFQFHKQNLKSWDEILTDHHQNLKPVIVWSSLLTQLSDIKDYFPNNRFIIQSWGPSTSEFNSNLIKLKYKLIVSSSDKWYLDHGFRKDTAYHDWREMYDYKLIKNEFVLGGEACMWTELADDYVLDSRIWPRAGAVAERLWSDPEEYSELSDARFHRFRERLIARGLRPDVVESKFCILNEVECL